MVSQEVSSSMAIDWLYTFQRPYVKVPNLLNRSPIDGPGVSFFFLKSMDNAVMSRSVHKSLCALRMHNFDSPLMFFRD